MINTFVNNNLLQVMTENFAYWHHERNLVDGATNETQSIKGLEEFCELMQAIHKKDTPEELVSMMKSMLDDLLANGRIKTDESTKTVYALMDAIGDLNVVNVNYGEREGFTLDQCFTNAWLDIKDRKGKMINGTFVKESDL